MQNRYNNTDYAVSYKTGIIEKISNNDVSNTNVSNTVVIFK